VQDFWIHFFGIVMPIAAIISLIVFYKGFAKYGSKVKSNDDGAMDGEPLQ
jgi:hypothetical protein